jgi:periplasmic protein TonB
MNDLGNLSNCVVDGVETAGWARRLRRKAFLGSLVLEAAAVGAMLLWPLITPAVLPAQLSVTPVPPYRAERPTTPATQPHESIDRAAGFTPILLHPTLGRPHSIAPGAPGDEPVGPGVIPFGGGPGPSIPGGSNDGRPIEVPRPVAPRQPLKVSAGVMAALLIHRVQPDYPAIAKAMHLSGTVELQARIGTDGTVQELEVVSGNAILARAAVEAVQQWRYQPTRLSGEPVEVETHITVTFSME